MPSDNETRRQFRNHERRLDALEVARAKLPTRMMHAEFSDKAEEFIRSTTLALLDSEHPPSGRSSGDIGIVTGGSSIYEGDTFKVNSDEDEWIPFHHWKATTKAGLPAAAAGVEISHIGMVTAGAEAGRHYVRNAANTEWDCISHWEK